MFLLDPPSTKAVTSERDYYDAAVQPTDPYTERWRSSDAPQLIARLVSTLMICCTINAVNCSRVPLRLYRPVKAGRQRRNLKYRAVPVKDRKRNEWLRRADGTGPGMKAAQTAMGAEDIEEVVDHPVLDLLSAPCDGYTGGMFRTLAYLLREATGRCGYLVEQAKGSPVPTALHMLFPQHMRVTPGNGRIIDKFHYGVTLAQEKTYDAEDVVYLRHMPSPQQPWNAIGPAHAITAESDLLAAAVAAELNRWQRGAQPDWWLSVSERTTEKQINQIESQIKNRLAGVRKKQNHLVLPGGMKAGPMGLAGNEMGYIEGQDVSERRIRNSYSIPESKTNLNAANLASALTSERQYQADCLLPRSTSEAEQLTAQLLAYYEPEPGMLWFAPDNPVTADMEAESLIHERYLRNGAITLNEVRQELGREPVEEAEADRLLFNGVPLDRTGTPIIDAEATITDDEDPKQLTDGKTPATGTGGTDAQQTALNGAQITAVTDMVARAAAGEIPLDSVLPTMRIGFPNTPVELIEDLIASLVGFEPKQPEPPPEAPGNGSAGSGAKPGDDAGGDPPESGKGLSSPRAVAVASVLLSKMWADGCGHKDDDKGKAPPYQAFQQAMEDYFTKWQPVVIGKIDPLGTVREYLNGDAGAFDELTNTLFVHTAPPMLDGNNGAVAKIVARAGEASDIDTWNVPPQDAINFLRDRNREAAGEILKTYDETVRAKVSEAIAGTLEAGQVTGGSIQARVAEALPAVHKHKAEIIASTETQRAFTEGARNAYDKSDYVSGYDWILSGDPCPFCLAMSETHTAKGEAFLNVGDKVTAPDGSTMTNDYGPVNGPPLHPRCACILEPRFTI